jgi:NADP-dependent 3-hydroxy acid dehydrogenase YdfG
VSRYMITGATRGIGRALVDLLSPSDSLIALGRTSDSLARLTVACRIVADLAQPDELADRLPKFESLDGLVHCAGVLDHAPVSRADVGLWRRSFDVNVVAAAELTRLLLPALRASGGTVVFVNSGQGLSAAPNLATYAATKHALRAVAESLRAEEPGIRVCSIYLGRTATDMQRTLRDAEQGTYDQDRYLSTVTVAQAIAGVLRLPADAVVTDLTLRPRCR